MSKEKIKVYLYIRSKSDVTKLVTNLIQNTNSPNIKNSSADPFWEKAELLQKNWKTILYLLDEAQFVDADTPPKLDLRMEEPLEIFSSNDIPLGEFCTGIDGDKKTKSKEPLLLVHFKSFRYSDGEQPFCL